MRDRSLTWRIGGIGLIACGVLVMLRPSLLGLPGAGFLQIAGDTVFAASVLLFAFGITRDGSVVARGPLGVVAMVIVGVWPLASAPIGGWVFTDGLAGAEAMMIFGSLNLLVAAGAAVIAATQIARARVVPAPWRWAPLWALALQACVLLIPGLTLSAVGPVEAQTLAGLFSLLGMLGLLASTLGLGILALILAVRTRPDTVEVFRSA